MISNNVMYQNSETESNSVCFIVLLVFSCHTTEKICRKNEGGEQSLYDLRRFSPFYQGDRNTTSSLV